MMSHCARINPTTLRHGGFGARPTSPSPSSSLFTSAGAPSRPLVSRKPCSACASCWPFWCSMSSGMVTTTPRHNGLDDYKLQKKKLKRKRQRWGHGAETQRVLCVMNDAQRRLGITITVTSFPLGRLPPPVYYRPTSANTRIADRHWVGRGCLVPCRLRCTATCCVAWRTAYHSAQRRSVRRNEH